MNLKHLAIALPLFCAACAADQTPLDRVALIEKTFVDAQIAFLGYSRFPDCDTAPKPCSDDEVIARIGVLDKQAFDAKEEYRNAVISDAPADLLSELYLAANTAVSAYFAATTPLTTP